ncbi:fimbrial protein [Pseudomonas carnis]|uniref:hypothetical protein n=1 Tax=Pseudomonas carnis TaxID=2487355 RepID=UPI001CA6D5ED|nr:hypothetical protein [Pseudomonas carnis]MBY8954208.1 fimbrial protein [Pseudomonas carnis]
MNFQSGYKLDAVSKKQIAYAVLAVLTAVCSMECSAVTCDATGGSTNMAIVSPAAIPSVMTQNSYVWRSANPTTITLRCWTNRYTFSDEYIYFYLNPKAVDLGSEVGLGIEFMGQYYRYPETKKIKTALMVPRCYVGTGCSDSTYSTVLTYSVFLYKKTPPASLKTGNLSTTDNVVAFQFDGAGGLGATKTVAPTLSGISGLKYEPCESRLSISPKNIDFGKVYLNNSKQGEVVKNVAFTITENRACSSAYGVDLSINAIDGVVRDLNVLVPDSNKSVGIGIFDASANKLINFGQPFVFSNKESALSSSKRYEAQLKWVSPAAMVGKFAAGVVVNVIYN